MTAQPRGPARAGIPADKVAHAQQLEEERLLGALLQYGPLKFAKLARLGLPGCGLGLVRDAVARLHYRGAIRCSVTAPETWQITATGRERLGAERASFIGAQEA